MGHARRWVLAMGVAAVTLAGCEGVTRTPGGGVAAVNSKSLSSVFNKMNDLNRDIGDAVREGEWDQVSEESMKLDRWSRTAGSLKDQSPDPAGLSAQCDQVCGCAQALQTAAAAKDAAKARANHAQLNQLLSAMGSKVK